MKDKKYNCKTCSYVRYRDEKRIFCDVCIRRIIDEQKDKQRKENIMDDDNKMMDDYAVEQGVFIGDKEVLFGANKERMERNGASYKPIKAEPQTANAPKSKEHER